MFWANTSPVPVAVTDFGEIAPFTVATRVSKKSWAGSCGVVVVVVVVVEVETTVDVDRVEAVGEGS